MTKKESHIFNQTRNTQISNILTAIRELDGEMNTYLLRRSKWSCYDPYGSKQRSEARQKATNTP
jgi:hypothetical protein